MLFILPIPSRRLRIFSYLREAEELNNTPISCYPFYDVCQDLVREISGAEISNDNIVTLFSIFESLYYKESAYYLKQGYSYYFEDIIRYCLANEGQEGDVIALNKAGEAIIADPIRSTLERCLEEKPPEPTLTTSYGRRRVGGGGGGGPPRSGDILADITSVQTALVNNRLPRLR